MPSGPERDEDHRMLALQYTHTNTRDHPYLGELPAYIKHKREAGGGEREAQKDGKNCPVLHCEAEQSSKPTQTPQPR